jgi:hypothetical protein
MARDHAQIRLDMWGDDDWRKSASPPSTSTCCCSRRRHCRSAVSPTGARRGSHSSPPTGRPDDVLEAASELCDRLFLVIDDETEEVLIRSFVRHDGLMKMPNMATAMATSHAGIASARLRGVVVHELRKLHEKQPDLAGWKSQRALAMLERNAIDPSVNPSRNPSVKGSVSP